MYYERLAQGDRTSNNKIKFAPGPQTFSDVRRMQSDMQMRGISKLVKGSRLGMRVNNQPYIN